MPSRSLLAAAPRGASLPAAALPAAALLAAVLLAALAAGAASAQTPGGLVRSVTGPAFAARLVRLSAPGEAEFARLRPEPAPVDAPAAESTVRLPLADFANWGFGADLGPRSVVLLADGSRLVARSLELSGSAVVIDSALFGETRVSLERVRGLVLRPPALPLARDELVDRIFADRSEQDTVLLENGDVLRGVVLSPPPRALPSPDAFLSLRQLRLETGGRTLEIPAERVLATWFNAALLASGGASETTVELSTRDGGRLAARRAEIAADRAEIVLACGLTLTALGRPLTAELCGVTPRSPRVLWLSERKPASYKHVPLLSLAWPYREDRNALGGWLRAGGGVYARGLGTHGAARLAYALPPGHARFEAEFALDDAAAPRGSVIGRVFLLAGDGWKPAFASEVVRAGAAPTPVVVELGDAKALALLVEHADRGDEGDHANWLDARLVK